MRKLQEHIIQLIKEIDETCRDHHIPYALYGRTAGCALKDQAFVDGCYQFQIMMLAADIVRLKELMEGRGLKDRGFEDFSVNPDLQYLHVRYVDTATTLFEKNYAVDYIMPGAAVTIIPLYTQPISKVSEVLETGLIYLNGKRILDRSDQSKRARRTARCIRLTELYLKVFGRKKAAERIWRVLEGDRGKVKNGTLIIRGDEDTGFADFRKNIRADYLFRTKRTPFEGLMLPVSEDSSGFFTDLYGAKWKETAGTPLASMDLMNIIWDDGAPYTEYYTLFAGEGVDMKELFRKERALKDYKVNVYAPWKKRADRYLYYGRRSVKRIDHYLYYRDKLDDLRKAEKEGDIEKIRSIMKGYLRAVERYRKLGLPFYVNDELHHFAELTWKNNRKQADYGKKIYAETPEVYKKKDIGEYMKQYQ